MARWLHLLSAALLGVLSLAAAAQTQQVQQTQQTQQVRLASAQAQAQDTLQRINTYRASGATCGLKRFAPAAPLAWNRLLEQAAHKHAKDMAARRTMSHTGGDGSSMSERVAREAYAWASLGENVSAGYKSVPDALAGWMRSPGHCANMMSPAFREVGVAAASAHGDSYGWYRAMVLGSQAR